MPVASATKAPRPRVGGKDRNREHGNVRKYAIERPPVTPFGRNMAMAFNWLQDEGVPMAKAIAKLRSIYNEAVSSSGSSQGPEEFFLYTSFFLQMPISSGTVKERMAQNDEKILETVCKFAVSFLQVRLPTNRQKFG